MQGALQYIATHLDYYYFNTDEARQLKREIQQWTVLPVREQAQAAERQELLGRFRSMFTNNPFLEQKGFVSDAYTRTVYPGGITGAAAEGFFETDNTCLTLRKKGVQQGDEDAVFLTDGMIAKFVQRKSGEAAAAVEQMADASAKAVEKKRADFAHILNPVNKADNKTRHNPGLISAAVTLLFYGMTFYYIFFRWRLIDFFRAYIDRLHLVSGDMWVVTAIAAASLVLGIFRFRTNLNMVVKGAYRAFIRFRFRIAQKKQRKFLRTAAVDLNPSRWYESFAEALKQDRERLNDEPDLPARGLRSAQMLSRPGRTIYLNRLFPQKPWALFRTTGEKRKTALMVLLLAAMILTQ